LEKYEIMNEKGRQVGRDILIRFYGRVWESALDRLCHRSDGHLLTIRYQGENFRVYRRTTPSTFIQF
jgi:hypothetical protein